MNKYFIGQKQMEVLQSNVAIRAMLLRHLMKMDVSFHRIKISYDLYIPIGFIIIRLIFLQLSINPSCHLIAYAIILPDGGSKSMSFQVQLIPLQTYNILYNYDITFHSSGKLLYIDNFVRGSNYGKHRCQPYSKISDTSKCFCIQQTCDKSCSTVGIRFLALIWN